MKEFDIKVIDQFDAYLSGEMTEEQRAQLEQSLQDDEQFNHDFQEYKLVVSSLVNSADQQNRKFGEAMASVNRDDLAKFLESKRHKGGVLPLDPPQEGAIMTACSAMVSEPELYEAEEKPAVTMPKKHHWWQWASAAVVVIMACGGAALFFMPHHAPQQQLMASASSEPKVVEKAFVAEPKEVALPLTEEDSIRLGNAEFALKNFGDLAQHVEVVEEIFNRTHNKEAGVLLGNIYLEQGNLDRARNVAMELVKEYPDDAEVETLEHKVS